jgi:hypothetical protein
MRVIFQEPRNMTEPETHYFNLINTTNDNYGISYETIMRHLNDLGYSDVKERDIRTWNERWNEFKYINVIPTYNIRKVKTKLSFSHKGIKYRFRKINSTSEHSLSILDKSRLDMIEYILKYRNRLRVLGDVNTLNSIRIEELLEGDK